MNFTPYAIILAIVSIGATGFLAHHYGVVSGEKAISLQDAAVLAKANAANEAKIAALTNQLETAQNEYDQTLTQLDGYVLANPVGVVRLCGNPHSGSPVSSAPAHSGSAAAAGSAPGAVQPVPAGDSSAGADGGADIGSLLGLLAQRADQVAAQLSALQLAEQNR